MRDLPSAPLDGRDGLGARFGELGLREYRAAARYVRDLPYGRNADRSDYGLVLVEGRGTCSTKHALLAALAGEQGLAVALRIGVYMMDGENTPGVGSVLQGYGILALPEAHCYLAYRGRRVDVTTPEAVEPGTFLAEETIDPGGIGAHKVERHRAFVERWSRANGLDSGLVWEAREACIAALSETPRATRPPSR